MSLVSVSFSSQERSVPLQNLCYCKTIETICFANFEIFHLNLIHIIIGSKSSKKTDF